MAILILSVCITSYTKELNNFFIVSICMVSSQLLRFFIIADIECQLRKALPTPGWHLSRRNKRLSDVMHKQTWITLSHTRLDAGGRYDVTDVIIFFCLYFARVER